MDDIRVMQEQLPRKLKPRAGVRVYLKSPLILTFSQREKGLEQTRTSYNHP